MKEIIAKLNAEQKIHERAAKACQETIRALQACCPHTVWEDDGHDSHHNYRRCTECGLTR